MVHQLKWYLITLPLAVDRYSRIHENIVHNDKVRDDIEVGRTSLCGSYA
jgi:hypothetical protein